MPEPDLPNESRNDLGDLFDDLPTAAPQLPEAAAEPAAGSRRAAREARRTGNDGPASAAEPSILPFDPQPREGASEPSPATSVLPAVTAAPSGIPAPTPSSGDDGGGLHDLFAPEAHREQPKKRGKGCLIALLIVLVLGGGIAVGVTWVWNTYGDKISDVMGWGEPKDYSAGQAHGEVLVTIKEGDNGSSISKALHAAGVTKTSSVFYDTIVAKNLAVTFYPGVYKLQKGMTAEAALAALDDKKNRMENTASVGEGSTIDQMLPNIAASLDLPLDDFKAAVANPAVYGVKAKTLEGWLFPAIYTFDPGVTAKDVIAKMVARTRESLAAASVPEAEAQRVLTIASIIQREGRVADFAKVSRVIQNRLDDGMKLQMDSTAQYGFGELHAGKVSTSAEAQHDPNPWNTYVHEGLPATPIASPSDAAIAAAMHPADGPWFYFVTINPQTGDTVFSVTYEEHQAAIKKWAAWCKANGNPSNGCAG